MNAIVNFPDCFRFNFRLIYDINKKGNDYKLFANNFAEIVSTFDWPR